MASEGLVFVTGWPGFIGRRLLRRMAEQRPGLRLALLVRPDRAAKVQAELPALAGAEARVLEGDVTRMHLGLSGPEFKQVTREATEIWHLAAVDDLSAESRRVR